MTDTPLLTPASVAFLLFHKDYTCTLSSLTIREHLEKIEAEVRRAHIDTLTAAANEVVRFYGTDRTWSLQFRTLLGSRIDDLDAILNGETPTPAR